SGSADKRLEQVRPVGKRLGAIVRAAVVRGVPLVGGGAVSPAYANVWVVASLGVATVCTLNSTRPAAGTKAGATTHQSDALLCIRPATPATGIATRPTLPRVAVVAQHAVAIGTRGRGIPAADVDGPGDGHVAAGQQVHRCVRRVLEETDGHARRDVDRRVVQHAGFGQLDVDVAGRMQFAVGAGTAAV